MGDNYVVEEVKAHDEIGLQGFDFNCFEKDEGGGGGVVQD